MSDEDTEREAVRRWRSAPRRRPQSPPAPGPGRESVWDYPRPPRLEPVRERVSVEFAGVLLADSTRALRVCETASPPTYYVPPEDARLDLLVPVPGSTLCEWKGRARYFSARVGDQIAERAAWSYPQPFAGFAALASHLAFFPSRVDACRVGGETVRPQPGGYYGGWITRNLVGPFKGEPGTESW